MREIKFRAWDRKMKKMFPVHEIRLNPNGGNLIEIKGYDDWDIDGWTVHGGTRMMYANEDRYILNQFTGLKDKNGREIYEGDIVRYLDQYITSTECGMDFDEFWNVGAIFFDNAYGRYDISNKCGVDYEDIFDGSGDFEVIGNIYKNPELIKEVNA